MAKSLFILISVLIPMFADASTFVCLLNGKEKRTQINSDIVKLEIYEGEYKLKGFASHENAHLVSVEKINADLKFTSMASNSMGSLNSKLSLHFKDANLDVSGYCYISEH